MDGRKGLSAGIRRLGPVQSTIFWITIIGLVLGLIYFLVPLILSYVEKEKAALSGELLPGSAATPLNQCGDIPAGANAIFLGNSVSYSSRFPHTVIRVGGQDLLVIDREKNKVTVSAKFFSKDGKIVAELKQNKFFINPNNYFRLEKSDKHSLRVYDQEAQEVLNVEFINPKTIKLLGIFYFPNHWPILIKEESQSFGGITMSRNCFGENNVDIGIE